jgi:hypothetical protein
MASLQSYAPRTVPGVYVTESLSGSLPASLATHSAVYMIGTSTALDAPVGRPHLVVDLTDFVNTFGANSPSYPSVRLFFRQRPKEGLWFINIDGAGAVPTPSEVEAVLQGEHFTAEMPQGFIIAPELYQAPSMANSVDELQEVLEAHCSDSRFYWATLVDGTPAINGATSQGAFVTEAIALRNTLVSPIGHSSFYPQYLLDLEGEQVPTSAAIAGLALRRYRAEGYRQSPAGVKYPIFGVQRPVVNINDEAQSVLNPIGINVIRDIPRRGVVAWGARTLSPGSKYKYLNARVILNVLAGTFRTAFDELVFETVDGSGAVFAILKATSTDVLEPLRTSGALFGASPDQAYLIVADETNNPASLLQEGIVNLNIYVKISPVLEFLNINITKAALSEDLSTFTIAEDVDQAPDAE